MNRLALLLVLCGALTFIFALKPINQLRRRLPQSSCRTAWRFLFVLILFFFTGYLVYAYMFWGLTQSWA